MIKKCGKLLFAGLSTFFLGLFSTNAAELNLEELANAVKEIEPNATYVYVIGEYAFTSEHLLTTQDVMVAARSIAVEENSTAEELYNAMTIVLLDGTFDSNYDLNGLEYVKNVVGTAAEKETYNIKYVDYEELVVEPTEVEVNELVNNAYNTIEGQVTTDKFAVSKNGNEITVSIVDTTMDSLEALEGTGVATAAKNLLQSQGVKEVTIAGSAGTPVTVNLDNLFEKAEELLDLFYAIAGEEGTAADLAGEELEITIALEEGYVLNGEATFTVKFEVNEVETEELVNNAYNTIEGQVTTDKFAVSKNGNEITVSIVDTTMDSLEALEGTGVATAAKNLLQSQGVKEVTIAGSAGTPVTVNLDNLFEKAEELLDLFYAIAGEEGTAADLAGEELEITIALEEGYVLNGEATFTVKFEVNEVEIDF